MSSLCTINNENQDSLWSHDKNVDYSQSNSKNSGSRGGATGSSSGSCWYNHEYDDQNNGTRGVKYAHMLPDKDELVHPLP